MVGLLGGLLAACGDDRDGEDAVDDSSSSEVAPDDNGGSLVLYSGRDQELVEPLIDQFQADTGISVEVRWGDPSELALLVETEDGASPADLFLSQSPGAAAFLAGNGRLAELPEDITSQVEPEDAAADRTWVGVSGRIRTLVYNTEEVDPTTLPDSVLDLPGEDYADQIGVAPTNGSFQDFVTVLRSELGGEETAGWLDALAGNNPPTFDGNTAIGEAVGRGEIPVGLVNHYDAFTLQDENPDLPLENYFFPDGDYGSTMLTATVSLLEGAQDNEAAVKFVEYLVGEAGQTYFAEETFEYPLAIGAEPNPALPPLDEIEVTRIDLNELGDEFEGTVDMINESGITR